MLEHDTLLKTLKDEKLWGLHALVEGLPLKDRPKLVRTFVAAAAKGKDEACAIRHFELLRLAINDINAAALQAEGLAGEPYLARRSHFEDRANEQLAEEAFSLWQETPPKQEAPWRRNEPSIKYEPTLVAYKQKLMEVLVQRWRETDSAEEAEALLDVILAVMKRDLGAGKFLTLAILETKDHKRHRDRTLRGIVRMITTTKGFASEDGDPIIKLWIGMVRGFNRYELHALGLLLRQLPLSRLYSNGYTPNPIIAAVAREAAAYRQMDDVIGELCAALKRDGCKIYTHAIDYPSHGHARMTLAVSAKPVDKNKLQQLFEAAAEDLHRQAAAWLKKRKAEHHDAPSICLTVEWSGTELARTFEIT